jgi:hypothetical protein
MQVRFYTFDGTNFTKTNKPFATRYGPGTIDSGQYYAIWPDGVALPVFPQYPNFYKAGSWGTPNPGDLCFLGDQTLAGRYWIVAISQNQIGALVNLPPATLAAEQAAAVYPRLMSSALKSVLALNQLTEGWQGFDGAVKSNLITGDRDKWTKLPMLTA